MGTVNPIYYQPEFLEKINQACPCIEIVFRKYLSQTKVKDALIYRHSAISIRYLGNKNALSDNGGGVFFVCLSVRILVGIPLQRNLDGTHIPLIREYHH